ncbi:hypothetical protein [Roseibium sp.]|uniref:hypothetical protein n=1 Tax=Roseibium sp. TaxID=1936156 RepID=UPI003D0F70CB
MTRRINEQIAEILKDQSRSKKARIDELLQLRDDARALERAATESSMATSGPDDSGLRELDRVLEKLGHHEILEAEDKSAATL